MLTPRHFFFALCCVFVGLTAHAAETGPECAAKLASHEPYLGAVRARLEAKRLSLEQLAAIAESDRPVNPFAGETPFSQNASAIRIFEALTKNPEVIKNWPKTRELLRHLHAKLTGTENVREEAAQYTDSTFLNPKFDSQIDDSNFGYDVTTLPDQRAVVAHIHMGSLLVTDIVSKDLVARIPFPEKETPSQFHATWHVDKSGEPWIYLSSMRKELDVYRAKLSDKKFTPVVFPENLNLDRGWYRLAEVKSMLPGLMLAILEKQGSNHQPGQYDLFNLESGEYKRLESPLREMLTKDPREGISLKPNPRVLLRTTKGELLVAVPTVDGLEIIVHGAPEKTVLIPAGNFPLTANLSLHEDEGHIYLAAFFENRLQIFEPFVGVKPIAETPASAIDWAGTHWFHSPTRDLYFAGCGGGDGVALVAIDILTGRAMSFPIPAPPRGFATVGGQTYFAAGGGEKIDIFRLFNKLD